MEKLADLEGLIALVAGVVKICRYDIVTRRCSLADRIEAYEFLAYLIHEEVENDAIGTGATPGANDSEKVCIRN